MPKTDPIDKIDLRVGFITSADKHPDADKLYVLSVDLGEFDLATSTKKTLLKRTIVSGLVDYYLPDELVGRKVVVFANMKPRKLRGVLSQGMLLAASNSNNGSIAVEILEAPRKSRPGDRVVVSNAQQSIDGKIIAPGLPALEKPLVKKQKVIDAFISGLALDACVAKYNGHSLVSESGGNVSTKSMLSGTVG
ncbi:hypothetical protein GGI25_001530 [Coemansia spiralis]|uniref:tRNA-binding domain-containing protein n=2 Tax=Coemansia TaxID=4863 RepID=A0A9W8GAS2_9FUNG|nr:hypothetical protein BX070DRAFT_235905 [Coemansia spiralis]KAJ1993640.1 hypothetical protein EDC05_002033 [Coemansia umbellata]KAJ2622993.1 hypothetical protein GGI26_002794 [Coemansia sp. RSA 1358]KAJ2679395.1 hypothetical protein GGI25_001530 [Coemansia spiralis]